MRRLRTTRRIVPLDTVDDYLDTWAAVRRAVEDAGGRAWIFRGVEHEDRFMEFIEWAGDGTPVDATRLDEHAPPVASEEWEEVE